MKRLLILLILPVVLLITEGCATAENRSSAAPAENTRFRRGGRGTTSAEDQVRAKEREMAAALVANDVETLKALFAEDFMVNNPANMVLTGRGQVMDRVAEGIIRYDRFEQKFELVRAYGDLVYVMGEETVRPIGNAPGAGQILRRRYTNVWSKIEGEWRLQARHANVVVRPGQE